MNHLIIYAHPNDTGFCNAIRKRIISLTEEQSIEITVSDLYNMGFNPILGSDDFEKMKTGQFLQDVAAEQAKINNADYISFIFPIWWQSMPAILKGYIDRVFAYNYAYTFTTEGYKGLLKNKRFAIFCTAGQNEKQTQTLGMDEAMNMTIGMGIFGFCDLELVVNKTFYNVPASTLNERHAMLNDLNELIVKNLFKRPNAYL